MNIPRHERSDLAACEAGAASVTDVESFKQWMRTDVRRILPHGFCACVHGRIYGVGVSPDYVIAVDYPLAHLAAIRNASGHMDTPLAERWYKTRQPVFFDEPYPWPELSSMWLKSFREHHLRNALADGVIDTKNCIATYFSFHQLPAARQSHLLPVLEELTPILHATLMRMIAGMHQRITGSRGRLSTLTDRERQIATWIGKGKSNVDIAALLHLSQNTIKHHLTSILDKTGCANRAALAGEIGRQPEATPQIGTEVL